MAGYLGNTPIENYSTAARQAFSSPTGTGFTLSKSVSSSNDIALFVNNIRQEPTTYTAAGTALTLTEALVSGDTMWCMFYGQATHTVNPPDGSVGTAKVSDNAITLAKMAGGTDGQIITYDASGDPVAVGPGTDGQVLTSTGAGSPPAFEDASGGAWAVKTRGTFSAAISLGITGISKWTRIFLYNLRSSSGDLMFRTSSDNGSSYDSGGSDYQYYRHQNGFEGNSANQSQISTAGEAYSSTSQDDAMVILDIPNPTGTSPTLIKWELIHNDDASIFHRFGMGVRSSAADVDAIQISTPSGNITGSYIVTELN